MKNRLFHTTAGPVINTTTSGRCKDWLSTRKLFQQFVARDEKPLKRLEGHRAGLHRAKAAVLMRTDTDVCEILGLVLAQRRFLLMILCVTLAGSFGLTAQDGNAVVQTNEIDQVESLLSSETSPSLEASADDEPAGTNAVAETNLTQTASPGPDARTRRLRRRSQNRSHENAQANSNPRPGSTATNGVPAALDYSAFRLIVDRNIFDPNRSPRSTRPSQPKTAQSFTLVGTMSYERGVFAFFDGTGSEYKKVLKLDGAIAGYKVVAISADCVKLMLNTNVLQLNVGAQMRQREDGAWEPTAGRASYAASSTSASESETAPRGAESDVIKRMMQRREKE